MSDSCLDSPTTEVTRELIATLVERAGYTHSLFKTGLTPADVAVGPPLPGQGVLLLMGGLVEQSGALDNAIALLELRRVRFLKMLHSGSTLRVEIRRGTSRVTSGGKIVQDYEWTGIDGDGERVVEAEAVMLMNPESDGPA